MKLELSEYFKKRNKYQCNHDVVFEYAYGIQVTKGKRATFSILKKKSTKKNVN